MVLLDDRSQVMAGIAVKAGVALPGPCRDLMAHRPARRVRVGDLADPPRLTAREEAFLCILLETGVCRPSDEQLPPLEQVVDKAEEAS